MATLLKQSTAVDVMLGPFLDDADGKTAKTALTITQPDIRLSKNGGAFAQKSAAQTLSHGENGWYAANLSTTDTNTLGSLIVAVAESGALPVWREFMVVPAAVYDAIVSGSGNGVRADVQAIAANAITATSIAADAIQAAKIQDGAFSAAKFASGAFDAVWSVATRLLTAGTNIVLAKGTGVTGFNDLDAAGVRGAVGLAAANLDTQLDTLPTADENADAVLDRANGIETGWTLRKVLRIVFSAASAGKLSGANTNTIAVRDVADTKDRIVATVDNFGNRSAVTLDGD